jgi:preprotein translocase subunit YajC
MFFLETAHAMSAAGESDGMGGMVSLLPIVMIFAIIYFLMIRPQHKRDQEHKAMLRGLKPGDRVMTAGGIYGTLLEVNEETVLMDAGNKIILTIARQSVGSLMPKSKVSKEERRARRERKASGSTAFDDDVSADTQPKTEFEGKSFDTGFDDDTDQFKGSSSDDDTSPSDKDRA